MLDSSLAKGPSEPFGPFHFRGIEITWTAEFRHYDHPGSATRLLVSPPRLPRDRAFPLPACRGITAALLLLHLDVSPSIARSSLSAPYGGSGIVTSACYVTFGY